MMPYDFHIWVDGEPCAHELGALKMGEVKTYTCNTIRSSTDVRVHMFKSPVGYDLMLCEVEVYTYPAEGQSL